MRVSACVVPPLPPSGIFSTLKKVLPVTSEPVLRPPQASALDRRGG
jgi:hypothetical protein